MKRVAVVRWLVGVLLALAPGLADFTGTSSASSGVMDDISVRDRQAGPTQGVGVDSLGAQGTGESDVVVHERLGPPTATVDVYLRGTGPNASPSTLILSGSAPTATDPRYWDSPAVQFAGGNVWKEVGRWAAAPESSPRTLSSLNGLHAWVGLKDSDDEGTQFDVRAEVHKNGVQVAAGTARCVTGITRNPNRTKEGTVAFDPAPLVTLAADDVLSLRVLTRIGTNPDGSRCPGPGGSHGSAVGLRLYFDAASRPSRFDATFGP